MGDFRIKIEAVGGHGCGREAAPGETIVRCGLPSCPDCQAVKFVEQLKATGAANVASATLEHWPVPGAAGTTRTENPGPIDDLLTGVRSGTFNVGPGQPYHAAPSSSEQRPATETAAEPPPAAPES